MLFTYYWDRLVSLVYGPIQFFDDFIQSSLRNGHFVGRPKATPLDLANVVDNVAPIGRLFVFELGIALIVLAMSAIIAGGSKKRDQYKFTTCILYYFSKIVKLLSILGIISRCFGALDFAMYSDFYSFIYSWRAYAVGVVRDIIWLVISYIIAKNISQKPHVEVSTESVESIKGNDPISEVKTDIETEEETVANIESKSATCCPCCGTEVPDDSLFCWKCGAAIDHR